MEDNIKKLEKIFFDIFSRIWDTDNPRYVKCRYPNKKEQLEVVYNLRNKPKGKISI